LKFFEIALKTLSEIGLNDSLNANNTKKNIEAVKSKISKSEKELAMKPTKLTIQDLFTKNAKLTFLIGAGCSVDAPSNLAAGRKMMEAIINYTCAESEKEKLLQLKQLRFEQLVEIIRDNLDPELKVIDYYGQCETPNLQHFFLAEMIKKGHFVMTTNFDFLIEHALLQSNVPKDTIIPVIIEGDFTKYDDPHELFSQGKKTVYKIHGSTKNMITGESTRDSLVATIQAFGSNKDGLNVFQIQPFQRKTFNNLSNGRSLVIMGYSGSDDFDVVPTLMILKNIKYIIWINYTPDDGGKEQIYEISTTTTDTTDKVNQILVDIKQTNNAEHVYRVDTNTTRLIEQLLDDYPNVSAEIFTITPREWLAQNLPMPSEIMKHYIPHRIYFDFNIYEDSMRCSEVILRLVEEGGDQGGKATVLNNIGSIYQAQGNYPEALKRYEQALGIHEQLGDFWGKTIILSNIGEIYRAKGNYPEALKIYEQALKISEQLGDFSGKAIRLNNIGSIYQAQGNYLEALKRYEQALKIDEQQGNLSGKAIILNNIGEIYRARGNYPEALKRYEQALKIGEQLGDLLLKSAVLNNIGLIYEAQRNYPEALKRYEQALKISEQLGDLSGKAIRLNNIGEIYRARGNYPEALKIYEQVLRIDEQLGDLNGKATRLNNIGGIYQAQGNYLKALKLFEIALKTLRKIGLGDSPNANNTERNIEAVKSKISKSEKEIKPGTAISLTRLYAPTSSEEAREYYNKGVASFDNNDLVNAVTYYEKAISIDPNYVDAYDNLGLVFRHQGNLEKAEYYYKKSIKMFPNGYLAHQNLAIVYRQKKLYDKALEEYKILKEIDPNDPEGYYGAGNIYGTIGKYELALENAKKALKLYEESNHPYIKDVQYLLGLIHYNRNEKIKAKDFLMKAKANGIEIPKHLLIEFNI